MKWFVDSRNKITKKKPFELKKELRVDLYLPFGLCTFKDPSLVINIESSFNNALEIIRSEFIDKMGLVEVFFTSKILFYEAEKSVNLYPKIKAGIIQMNKFMIEMQASFPCECEQCNFLREQTEKLYINVQFKELNFIRDYTMELGEEVIEGGGTELLFSMPNNEIIPFSAMRASLDNGFFKEVQGCLREVFFRFVSMHISVYQMQNHDIMPVFMLLYQDQTYKMLPFFATTKATFYRKVLEIIENSDFDELRAVFYCGQYYIYDIEQLSDIQNEPYFKRINRAQAEILTFTLLSKEEINIIFDEDKIDDMEYVKRQIREVDWNTNKNDELFGWLNPIRMKFQ